MSSGDRLEDAVQPVVGDAATTPPGKSTTRLPSPKSLDPGHLDVCGDIDSGMNIVDKVDPVIGRTQPLERYGKPPCTSAKSAPTMLRLRNASVLLCITPSFSRPDGGVGAPFTPSAPIRHPVRLARAANVARPRPLRRHPGEVESLSPWRMCRRSAGRVGFRTAAQQGL